MNPDAKDLRPPADAVNVGVSLVVNKWRLCWVREPIKRGGEFGLFYDFLDEAVQEARAIRDIMGWPGGTQR